LPPAVADAKERKIDEPGRAGPLHGIDDEADTGNHSRVVFQRHADPETAENCLMPADGVRHRLVIGDISDDHPQVFMADGKLARGASEGGNRMAFCQRCRDEDAPSGT
jgi:hypothetical protein